MRRDFTLYRATKVEDGQGSWTTKYVSQGDIFSKRQWLKSEINKEFKVDSALLFAKIETRKTYDVRYKDVIKDKDSGVFFEVYAVKNPSDKSRLYQEINMVESKFKIDDYIEIAE